MNDPREPRRPGQGGSASEEEAIAALLRLAGPRPAVPPERRERVRSAVQALWNRSVASRRRRRVVVWIVGSLAAAAAVVVTVGLGLRRGPSPGGTPGGARVEVVEGRVRSRALGTVRRGDGIAPGDEIRTDDDGRVAIRLGSEASLRVDRASRIELSSASSIELHRGAVYVDRPAAPGDALPVEIRTRLGVVTEVGTQFEVRLEGESVRIRVREGLVSLERGGRAYTAGSGRQLLAGAGSEVVASEAPRHGEAWAWTLALAPPFDLEGSSLQEFLSWVSRETGWPVRFEESSLAGRAAETVLHGSVEGLRPDEALATVLPTCGLRHRIEDGILVVGRVSESP